MALKLKSGNQPTTVQNEDIPQLRWTKKSGKCEQTSLYANLSVCKPISAHDILNKDKEAVHILATGDTGTLTLIAIAAFNLLRPSDFSIPPKRLNGFTCLLFVIGQI